VGHAGKSGRSESSQWLEHGAEKCCSHSFVQKRMKGGYSKQKNHACRTPAVESKQNALIHVPGKCKAKPTNARENPVPVMSKKLVYGENRKS